MDPHIALEAHLRRVGRSLVSSRLTGVREKAPLDLVSDLDLAAETEVTSFLRATFPGDAVLSEESASSVAYQKRIWVLDPLDGTLNRTSSIPFFVVSLGLLEDARPARGYVYDPVHDEMFTAVRGQGAYCDGERLRLDGSVAPGVALTSGVIERMVESDPLALVELLGEHGKLRNLGAQALHLAYVAAGRLSGAAAVRTRLWDNLAGALLVLEAGGRFTDFAGRERYPLAPDDPGLRGGSRPCLAAHPQAHATLLRLLGSLDDRLG